MKIGISVRRFGPCGGMEGVAYGFVRWLAGQGHTVEVWSQSFEDSGPRVHHRPLRAGGRGVIWKAHSLSRALRRIPTQDVDAFLHFERGGLGGAYRAGAGCHAAFRERCGGGAFGSFIEALDRETCRTASPLIVNSEMVLNELQQFYGIPSDQLRLVRNGVDLKRFRPADHYAQPTVVFVGSDARRKGLETAIQAMSRLDGVQLFVVGNVTNVAKRWAASAGVLERVDFLGWVERPETVVSRAHAMVLPTQYDPSSNAMLEAMAAGVPVVTSRSNGAAELSPEPWLVLDDHRDADHCAEVLLRAMEDSALPEVCRSVASSYDVDTAYAALLQAITEESC